MTRKNKNKNNGPRYLEYMKKDEDYKRWFINLKIGSINTANERARVLFRYCNHFGMTPKDLVDLANSNIKKVENQIYDFISEMHKKNRSPSYLSSYLKTIRNWLKFHKIKLEGDFRIGNIKERPTLVNESIPNKEQLKTIFDYADERGKVIISLMAFSGVRPQVLGYSDGLDGLKVGDLPEMKIQNGQVTFEKSPTIIIVRAKLSKSKEKYITFLCKEGMDYLNSYLEKRIAMGDVFNDDSPIITPRYKYDRARKDSINYGSGFVKTHNISNFLRRIMRPRFKWRPYVLRSYFDTMLMIAESHGKISHAYRQHFMGHVGDIEARYTTNRNKLLPEVIENMRKSYKECEEYIGTQQIFNRDPKEDLKNSLEDALLRSKELGFNPSEYNIRFIDGKVKIEREKDNGKVSIDEEILALQYEITKKHIPITQSTGTEYKNGQGKKHKVIPEDELVNYLNEGWELVKEINGEKYLIKKSI